MQKVPLFVELCAGTAALSLRLEKEGAKPPVSRMGAKTGYADRILTLLGLEPGQGADHYLWCEPDPGVRLLLEAYRDAELAQAAAAIIRGWADEEPRALWERLRAEGPPREAGGYEVARWLFGSAASYSTRFPFDHYLDPESGGRFGASRLDVARKTATLPEIEAATIAPDARAVDPRDVARAISIMAPTRDGIGRGRFVGWVCPISDAGTERNGPTYSAKLREKYGSDDQGRTLGPLGSHPDVLCPRLDALPTLPATIAPDARAVDPGPSLPPGTIAYIDPPYVGTTGYAHDLPRPEVVALARRWAAAGAIVCISEAEPIPELVEEGWHAVEITDNRKGQKRTFSKQQKEWLTMNQPPTYGTGPVFDMFG